MQSSGLTQSLLVAEIGPKACNTITSLSPWR